MLNNPALAPLPDREMQFFLGAYAGNDMMPVDKLATENWPTDYRTRSGSNLGIGTLRVEASAREHHWSVGYFYRQDWLLEGNRDTVDAFYLDQRNDLTSAARTYDLNYSLRGYAADGLRLGYSDSLALRSGRSLTWGISASLLHGRSVRQDNVRGQLVSQIGSGTLNGNRSYFDSQLRAITDASGFNDFAPPAPMESARGWGYGLDIGLSWQGSEGAALGLIINDLAGRIEWDRVPLIEQTVSNLNDPFVYGSAGSAISGRNSYTSLTFRLKPKTLLSGAYPLGRSILSANLEGTDGHWFPRLGVSYPVSEKSRIGLDYDTRFGSVSLSLRGRYYFLSVATQDPDFSASRAVGMNVGLSMRF